MLRIYLFLIFGFAISGIIFSQITTVFQDDFNSSSLNTGVWEIWDYIDAQGCYNGQGGTVQLSGGYCNFKNTNDFSSRVGITAKQLLDLSGKRTVISSTQYCDGDGITMGIGYLEMDIGEFTLNSHCGTRPFMQHTISFRYDGRPGWGGTSIFGSANGDTAFSIYSLNWSDQRIIFSPATYNIIFTAIQGQPKLFGITYEWIVNGDTIHRASGDVNFGSVDPSKITFGYSSHHYPPAGDPWNGDNKVDKIIITQEPITPITFPVLTITEPAGGYLETTALQGTLAGQVTLGSAPIKTISLLVNRTPQPISLDGQNRFSLTIPLIKGPNVCRVNIQDENGLQVENLVTFMTPMDTRTYNHRFPRLALMAHMSWANDNSVYIGTQYDVYISAAGNTEYRAKARSVNPGVRYIAFSGSFQGEDHGKEEWILKDYQGNIQWYDGRRTTNIAIVCPKVNDTTVHQWWAYNHGPERAKGSDLDGYCFDSFFDGIINIPQKNTPSNLDVNGNGVKDDGSDDTVTSKWLQGQVEISRLTRQQLDLHAPDKPLIINGFLERYIDSKFPWYQLYPYLNGEMIEYYPTQWSVGFSESDHPKTWARLDEAYQKADAPAVEIANVMYWQLGAPADPLGLRRTKRYWLTQILMNDAYAAIEGGGTCCNHNAQSVEWWEEYSVNLATGEAIRDIEPIEEKVKYRGYLGMPKQPRQLLVNGVYTREFDNGLVIFNPTQSSQSVPLSGTYHRIKGSISPENNGFQESGSLLIPAEDGLILIKKGNPQGIIKLKNQELVLLKIDINPNPFNSLARIGFELARPAGVSMAILDAQGKTVSHLKQDQALPAGSHQILWNVDRHLSSGVYLIQLQSGKERLFKKVLFIQ